MRFLLKLLLVLVVLAVIALGAVFYTLESIAETQLSKVLRVPVEIDSINFTLSGVAVHEVEIGNIPESTLQPAFKVDRVAVSMKPMRLLDQEVEIEKVEIVSPRIAIDMFNKAGTDNNWTRMTAHLQSENPPATSPETEQKEFVIRELRFTNIQIEAKNPAYSNDIIHPSPISELVLRDVGSKGGIELDELIVAITKAITAEIMKNFIDMKLTEIPMKAAEKTLKQGEKTLKKMIPGLKSDAEPAGEGENKGLFDKLFQSNEE
jgi:uncharacterized protein involved in outer membrane biogenesis